MIFIEYLTPEDERIFKTLSWDIALEKFKRDCQMNYSKPLEGFEHIIGYYFRERRFALFRIQSKLKKEK